MGRLTSKVLNTTNNLNYAYTYAVSERGESYTTGKVATETMGDTTYKYTYDTYGNITQIKRVNTDNTEKTLYTYTYDEYNQLKNVNDKVANTYTTYAYDESGNIIRKLVQNLHPTNGYPIGVESDITYTYGDSEWKDLLTTYNGQTLTYDAIGNPLAYRDGISFTWQNGRQLASYDDANNHITYTYDASGLRTGKAVTNSSNATIQYTYVYENNLLQKMTRGSRTFEFSYDAYGNPVGFRLRENDTASYYYYVLNSRGDVIALYSSDGTKVATYSYDAYGELLSTSTLVPNHQIAINYNPLRYRGYVYDRETGFYYLQTRYYDPTVCRFVNEDIYYDTGQGFNGFNMFAYCGNNPVCREDFWGNSWVDTLRKRTNQPTNFIRRIFRFFEKIVLKNNPPELIVSDDNDITYYNETDESVIARMLYGEDHTSGEAHLWMLQNRLDSGDNYGGSNFRELILSPNQFYAMSGERALNPKSNFGELGEKKAWAHCVDLAYAYTNGGIYAIPKPFYDFDYTYSYSYCDSIVEQFPNGKHIGGTWFYNR